MSSNEYFQPKISKVDVAADLKTNPEFFFREAIPTGIFANVGKASPQLQQIFEKLKYTLEWNALEEIQGRTRYFTR